MPIQCSLDRLSHSIHSCNFAEHFLSTWTIPTLVTAFLEQREFQVLTRIRICFYAERADLALSATAHLIHYAGSSWTVPTPPVAAWRVNSVAASSSFPSHFSFSGDHDIQSEAD